MEFNTKKILLMIFCLTTTFQMSAQITDIVHYFPDMSGDLSKVTWGHAINSEQELENNLNDESILMLEADVLMGHLKGDSSMKKVPIMAHPPLLTSDVTLEHWVDRVVTTIHKRKILKGIKLDFKQLEAVFPSLQILLKHKEQIDFPLLLNADILPGPGSPSSVPVDADSFLNICSEFFPEATLSIGWTTKFSSVSDPTGVYTMSMVEEMTKRISINSIGQPVTFPIRAAFVGRSLEALEYLIDNVEDSTISIWSSSTDTVDVEALVDLRDLLGHDIVYYDLPEKQMEQFNIAKDEAESHYATTPNSSLTAGMCKIFASPSVIFCFVVLAIAHLSIIFLPDMISNR